MTKRLLHTPEGVRDIYGTEYTKKIKVESLILDSIRNYGYKDIQTPTIEFFDVFSKEIGTTPSRELYKFFDNEGNTMVLRPDFTPSMARCAAKYFVDETHPIRFCYQGNTFTNTSNLQGKLKEVTQTGAELIGDDSVEADGEMICLIIDTLLKTGLKDFQVSIGQVDYFKGICIEAGLDEDTEIELRDFISGKNYFGAKEILKEKNIDESYQNMILKINDLFGTNDILQEAKSYVKNVRSLDAIARLEELYEVLCVYGMQSYVSFDLGMLSRYNYYTGVIFKAYTYGVGDAIVKGGRYDNLLERFGKNSAAIGFMIVIDDLMSALTRQKILINTETESYMVLYKKEFFTKALTLSKYFRSKNIPVELICENEEDSYENFAINNMHSKLIRFLNEDEIMEIDLKNKNLQDEYTTKQKSVREYF